MLKKNMGHIAILDTIIPFLYRPTLNKILNAFQIIIYFFFTLCLCVSVFKIQNIFYEELHMAYFIFS